MDTEQFIKNEDKMLKKDMDQEITSYHLIGTLFEQGSTVDFEYYFMKPNMSKVKVKIANREYYYEGYNGKRAWEMDSYVRGEPEIALRRTTQWPNPIRSVKDFVSNGHDATYKKIIEINGKPYHEVDLELADGMLRTYYFALETYTIGYIREYRKLAPDQKPRLVETELKHYKNVDGVKFAMHNIEKDKKSDEQLLDIQWYHVEVNPKLESSDFDKLDEEV